MNYSRLLFVTVACMSAITGFLGMAPRASAADCSVASTRIDPYTSKTGLVQNGWFVAEPKSSRPIVTLYINTADCAGQKIKVSLTGYDDSVTSLTTDIDALNDKEFTVPVSESFSIKLRSGEEACKIDLLGSGIGGYADCMFHIRVETGLLSSNYTSENEPQGNLNYESDGGANQSIKWEYISDTSAVPTINPDAAENTVTAEPGTAMFETDAACTGTDGKPIAGCYKVYEGLAQILEKTGNKFSVITDADSLGGFLNGVIAIIIGLAGVAAVVMIMYHGVSYMKSDNVSFKTETRGKIVKTMLGLLLLLTMYVILRTINPDLLNLVPRIENISFVTDKQYQQATGKKPKPKKQAVQEAIDKAVAQGVDKCIVETLVEKESGSNVKAIGHDENFASTSVPSRKTFIASGKKFGGATFSGIATDKTILNDDKEINPSAENLGLDWRFSHGIGLFQITIFPPGVKQNPPTALEADKNSNPTRMINNISYSAKALLDADTNIQAMVDLFAENTASCGNIKDAFRMYNGGKCSSTNSTTAANAYADDAYAIYTQCKAQ